MAVGLCVYVMVPLDTFKPCAEPSPEGLELSFVQPVPLIPLQVAPQAAAPAMKSTLPVKLKVGPAQAVQVVSKIDPLTSKAKVVVLENSQATPIGFTEFPLRVRVIVVDPDVLFVV